MDNITHIIISTSSNTVINLSDYGSTSLAITLLEGIEFWCVFNQAATESVDVQFNLSKNATLHCVLLISKGQNSTINVAVSLNGTFAHATVRGLYALNCSQQLAITTSQHHTAAHTTSNLIIKGMLNNNAHADYRGNILIDPGAHYTNAVQENKNMLLSATAHAQSIPSLEVLTNNVQCKHGSAVGYLDVQSLIYLQSRGLDEQSARQLLVNGFFTHILQAVDAPMESDIYEIVRIKAE